MKITGKPYLAIRRRRRQQQLEQSRRILSSSSSQSLPLCSCVSVCWVFFYLLSALTCFPFLFVFSSFSSLRSLFSLLLSSWGELTKKVMHMPAFSEFFTDSGFFFFYRDEDNNKANSSLCCPSLFSLSLWICALDLCSAFSLFFALIFFSGFSSGFGWSFSSVSRPKSHSFPPFWREVAFCPAFIRLEVDRRCNGRQ